MRRERITRRVFPLVPTCVALLSTAGAAACTLLAPLDRLPSPPGSGQEDAGGEDAARRDGRDAAGEETEGDAPPACGNGSLDEGEECDDGRNGDPDDGCTDDCAYSCRDDGACDDGHSCTRDWCDLDDHRCVHLVFAGGTLCRAAAGVCDEGESCDGSGAACPADGFRPATFLCRSTAGVCDGQESCTGSAAECPGDAFAPAAMVCRAQSGICDAAEVCTGSAAGCPADRFMPTDAVCRAQSGICDAAESCTGVAAACPADALRTSAFECRASAGACDTAEACSGSGPACPADAMRGTSFLCRALAGDCDNREYCTGSSEACPADALGPTGYVCRPAYGICQQAEVCTGSSTACPADLFAPAATVCRAASGVCDAEERCTGSASTCPANAYAPSAAVCRASSGICDAAESCTGGTATCPADALASSSRECRSAVGACDAEERCTGASPSCPADALRPSGTVCRTPAGTCDLAEQCTGGATVCPGDGLAPSTATCRDASGSCDVVESCTGTSIDCTADGFLPPGAPCDDGSYCTILDACGEAGACAGVPRDELPGVAAFSTGGSHTCALTTMGGVVCWGDNSMGQLGDGSTTGRALPVDVRGLTSGVSSVSAGSSHTCALTTGGGVKCWGANGFGQLGDGSTTDRSTPGNVSGLSTGASTVSAGSSHTCALTAGGGVKCWGDNYYGQLGDGSTTRRSMPVDVSGLSAGAAAVSAGSSHTCALMTGGGVKCWGYNYYGQLGDGSTTNRSTPGNVWGLSTGASAVSARYSFTCALTTGGGVTCWGNNTYGQLGDGDTTSRSTPGNVSGLSVGVAAVSAGGFHSCALMTGGGVMCWGNNGYGRLGDGGTKGRLTPVGVFGLSAGVSAVRAGGGHTCASTTAGGLKCWGSDGAGELGDGRTTRVTSPFDMAGRVAGASSIVAGRYHTCALTTAGGVQCWGSNSNGQLGDGTTASSRGSGVDVIGSAPGVAAVSAGGDHTCALTTSGGVTCWGHNLYGQLGDGGTADRSTPVGVSGLSAGAAAVSAGTSHTCALTTGGGVKCWGNNTYGQLGDGSTSARPTPVDVSGLSTGASAVFAGSHHTCALTTGGGVKCWGHNGSGRLGDGSTANRSTPVDVSGLASGVSAVCAGGSHTCALTASGGVMCWGENGSGQLGRGNTADSNVPGWVMGLASGVSAVCAGAWHTCALTSAGGVKCWGENDAGQLGWETTSDATTPVEVPGLSSGASAVAAGWDHTCALTTTGSVKCWGSDDYGQVTGFFTGYPHPVVCR